MRPATSPRSCLSAGAHELRVELKDGALTTVHAVVYPRTHTTVRVVALTHPQPLVRWCREQGVREAIVGVFFTRPCSRPLGELRIDGRSVPSAAFAAPWDAMRACVHCGPRGIAVARRPQLARRPRGDLLQAGPLLVAGGVLCSDAEALEGFRAGAHEFDSDITAGRYPRAGLGLSGEHVLAVTCDGRAPQDAAMTLEELAEFFIGCGAEQAINLDGGGSASLVSEGRLRNRPRESHGIDLLEGRSIATALVFAARRPAIR